MISIGCGFTLKRNAQSRLLRKRSMTPSRQPQYLNRGPKSNKNMNLNEAINLISRRDPSILNEHGEVFFSSRNSFNYNNKVMTIGLNPGGEGLPARGG